MRTRSRTSTSRTSRTSRRLVALAATTIAAGGLVAAATAAPAAPPAAPAAAAATSPIKLVAPVKTFTVERYGNEPFYLYDAGLYAQSIPGLEIRTTRSDYAKPVTGEFSVGDGASKVTTPLPAGLLTAADHIDKFYALKVTDAKGTTVLSTSAAFCPGTGTAARSIPTGAQSNPYPYQCGNHPFAQGYVLGIPHGWWVSTLGDYSGQTRIKGKDGTYKLSMTVSPKWRRALGISDADGTASVTLKLKSIKDVGPGAAAASVQDDGQAPQLAAAHDHAAAPKGVLSPQGVKLEAGRLKSLGTAATPKASRPTNRIAAAAFEGPKPDLRSLPAYQLELSTENKKTYLNFGATVWNAGPSPLVVDGFRRTGAGAGLMDAYQYFYDEAGKEVGSTGAGTLEWDPRAGHEHWHFTAFASYRLLNADRTLAVRSGKEAFCLAPTDGIDLKVPNANWRPASTDLTTACGGETAQTIREVLDVGWGDTYGQYLPGQSFDVTKVPNGVYYVQVLANPDKKLTESNTGNNSAYRKVKLGGTPGGKRSLKVYPFKLVTAP